MSSPESRPEGGFLSFDLGPTIQRGIAAMGFAEPRPIQYDTIPAALEGRDILGLAQTGTGKTAAFALPILERLMARKSRGDGPRVLIVAPTRELASQIGAEIDRLAVHTKIRTATVFGGVSIRSQIEALRSRPEILVACPGRLLDLWQQRVVRLDQVEMLVLDEADHMFDMGFLPDVRRILGALPAKRQNLMFSATMPPEIRRLAGQVLVEPHVVELAHSKPIETIDHALYPVAQTEKIELLEKILAEDGFVSAIVFTRTKHRAKRLAQKLVQSGFRAIALQGNMSQNARERAMNGFRKHEYDVLVATDIAARGIDVEQVSHVVNFDIPNTADAYTHRIGRTGRAEKSGRAYTFVTAEDHEMVRAVETRIGSRIPRRSIDGREVVEFPTERARTPARSPSGRSNSPRNAPRGAPRNAPRGGQRNGTRSGSGRTQSSSSTSTSSSSTSGNATSLDRPARSRRRRRPRTQ